MSFEDYLVSRLKDKNTWVGLTAILSLFGYHVTELELESILSVATGIGGAIVVFWPEKQPG